MTEKTNDELADELFGDGKPEPKKRGRPPKVDKSTKTETPEPSRTGPNPAAILKPTSRAEEAANGVFEQDPTDKRGVELETFRPTPYVDPKSPVSVNQAALESIQRMEEIDKKDIAENGRFIDGVDNARPGVPFNQRHATPEQNPATPWANDKVGISSAQQADEYPAYDPEDPLFLSDLDPVIVNEPDEAREFVEIKAAGFNEQGYLDTGDGAQEPDQDPVAVGDVDPIHDFRSEHYLTCMNGECSYRVGCMRYRMHDKKPDENRALFYPEDCRDDGIYQPVMENVGMTPMEVLEPKMAPTGF